LNEWKFSISHHTVCGQYLNNPWSFNHLLVFCSGLLWPWLFYYEVLSLCDASTIILPWCFQR
jgi:hypothetical protein